MPIVVSHPTANRNVRAIIESFYVAGLLAEFNTTVVVDPDSFFFKWIPSQMQSELRRRAFSIPLETICSHPAREILRMVLPKVGLRNLTQTENCFASIDSVYRSFDKDTARRISKLVRIKNIEAVYAYEDGALETFKIAKELGLKCIYDLPIAYWEYGRKLMQAEADRFPQWAITFGGGIHDSQEKLHRKTQELEMADMVIGPGEFVINSLPEWSKNKIVHIAPFGSPPHTALNRSLSDENRPLRILFAGSMGQRKGLGDLFNAMKMLATRNVELVVMGSLLAPMEFYRKEFADFTYEPGRPHEQVLALMRTCDVFCLPSIVEGRALVMQEAMSQGLPLIITANTGGQDLIIEGKTGFLVPVGSPEAIANKIDWFSVNRKELPEMSKMAQQHAANYTWDAYGASVANAIKGNLNLLGK